MFCFADFESVDTVEVTRPTTGSLESFENQPDFFFFCFLFCAPEAEFAASALAVVVVVMVAVVLAAGSSREYAGGGSYAGRSDSRGAAMPVPGYSSQAAGGKTALY